MMGFKTRFILNIAIGVAGFILFISPEKSVGVHLAALGIIPITASLLQKCDIYHPYVWYSTFFFLYASSYPILYACGEVTKYGYMKESVIYQWIALSIILTILPSNSYNYLKNEMSWFRKSKILNLTESMILIYILITIILIIKSPYLHKNEIYASGNIFYLIAFKLVYFATLIYCFQLPKYIISSTKNVFGKVLCFGSVIGMFSVVTGERNYLFAFILITAIMFFRFKIIRIKQLLLLAPICLLLLPLSTIYKYYFLSGNIYGTVTVNNLLIGIINSEFMSASSNLQILLSHNYNSYLKWQSVLNDFLRIFYVTPFSGQTWFNEEFFTFSTSTKYGFTLVGEGYVDGGILGIVVICCIVGILIRAMYIMSCKNPYCMAAYLYMIPLFIYATRADIANIFSPLIKYVLLGLILIWILENIPVQVREFKADVTNK